MKLLSWNIWKGKNLDRVITTLKDENPDVICLQEVKEDDTNQAKVIAENIGYNYIYCGAYTTERYDPPFTLGNAILTKQEITSQSCLQLSSLTDYQGKSDTEPRGAVICQIDDVTFVSAHIGYPLREIETTDIQKKQLQNLLNATPRKKCVIAGDFNSIPQSDVVKMLEEVYKNTDNSDADTRFETREGKIKKGRIDYIFVTSDIKFASFKITPSQASDHSLLTLEIWMGN